ncbi:MULTISPECIES: PEP-CTERM sorting domain-containing protein [unclassified Lentimonas]|uniref:PEP-CTERM sorting domain-containing protein n=1 Tax=unclassified Lentimonas TaxID=2630993 RepID=UPI0013237F2D|nr:MULTISPECIES: PEP-CTERM sorting domain-containing protein [unclassified Lentimonas]CAA6679925.1 Unannotated [Lentimonas sp. CC4]CAA6683439.1 Unannotated [Lentimonas sp. CC6]CAA7078086.1 Unannotated [Lentimonas sp. CC4]CAA7171619.1 Unannotated [Lentimonas sp. CC21]CAA7181405.1 Unannotated [Lentimonas sp. CC8]
MKKLYATFTASLFLAGIAQAVDYDITVINGDSAAVDYTDATFTGSVTFTGNNFGHNDNFTNADFSGTTITIGSGGRTGNQPFIAANITGTDFSGVTFNISPYAHNTADSRFNAFTTATGTGANFSNSTWNFTTTDISPTNTGFFSGVLAGTAGAANLAGKADAFDFSGATFTFAGATGTALTANRTLVIGNLGSSGTTEATAFGSIADAAFLTNNYAAFGYADAAGLSTALTAAGWQVIPEPSSYALLAGLLGMSYVMVRRRRA